MSSQISSLQPKIGISFSSDMFDALCILLGYLVEFLLPSGYD